MSLHSICVFALHAICVCVSVFVYVCLLVNIIISLSPIYIQRNFRLLFALLVVVICLSDCLFCILGMWMDVSLSRYCCLCLLYILCQQLPYFRFARTEGDDKFEEQRVFHRYRGQMSTEYH